MVQNIDGGLGHKTAHSLVKSHSYRTKLTIQQVTEIRRLDFILFVDDLDELSEDDFPQPDFVVETRPGIVDEEISNSTSQTRNSDHKNVHHARKTPALPFELNTDKCTTRSGSSHHLNMISNTPQYVFVKNPGKGAKIYILESGFDGSNVSGLLPRGHFSQSDIKC